MPKSALLLSAVIVLGAAIAPAIATAQERENRGVFVVTPKPPEAKPPKLKSAFLVGAPVKVSVPIRPRDTRSDLRGDQRARTADLPLNETSVLSAFMLRFANGDHQIKEISIERVGQAARGILSDENGDDNYSFSASWWNIPGTVSGEIRGSGPSGLAIEGAGGLEIPAGPPNTTLALVGFSLRAPQDTEIYSVFIRLDGAARKVFFDLALTSDSGRQTKYVIQYAWVPNAALNGDYSVTGGGMGGRSRSVSGSSGRMPTDDRHILRGFQLGYRDSGHSAQNLLEVGVNLAPGPNSPADRQLVSWRDNDLNEGIGWRIDYSVLK